MGGWITHRKTLYHDHILTVHKKFTEFTSGVRISLEQGVLTTHQGGPDSFRSILKSTFFFISGSFMVFSFSDLKGGAVFYPLQARNLISTASPVFLFVKL